MTLDQWKRVAGLAESIAKIVALGVGGAWTYLLPKPPPPQGPRKRRQSFHESASSMI
jgi:hypothetical protein